MTTIYQNGIPVVMQEDVPVEALFVNAYRITSIELEKRNRSLLQQLRLQSMIITSLCGVVLVLVFLLIMSVALSVL